MSKIAILTDSSCDIPQEMAEKYGIDIMSFHILLDDVDYVERESCTNTEFYDKMRPPARSTRLRLLLCRRRDERGYPDGRAWIFGHLQIERG